jgi:hypothetical protein
MRNLLAIIILALVLIACENDTAKTTKNNEVDFLENSIAELYPSCKYLTESVIKRVFPNASEIEKPEREPYSFACYYRFKLEKVRYSLSLIVHAEKDSKYKEIFEKHISSMITGSHRIIDGVGEIAYYSESSNLIVVGNKSILEIILFGAKRDESEKMAIRVANILLSDLSEKY